MGCISIGLPQDAHLSMTWGGGPPGRGGRPRPPPPHPHTPRAFPFHPQTNCTTADMFTTLKMPTSASHEVANPDWSISSLIVCFFPC